MNGNNQLAVQQSIFPSYNAPHNPPLFVPFQYPDITVLFHHKENTKTIPKKTINILFFSRKKNVKDRKEKNTHSFFFQHFLLFRNYGFIQILANQGQD